MLGTSQDKRVQVQVPGTSTSAIIVQVPGACVYFLRGAWGGRAVGVVIFLAFRLWFRATQASENLCAAPSEMAAASEYAGFDSRQLGVEVLDLLRSRVAEHEFEPVSPASSASSFASPAPHAPAALAAGHSERATLRGEGYHPPAATHWSPLPPGTSEAPAYSPAHSSGSAACAFPARVAPGHRAARWRAKDDCTAQAPLFLHPAVWPLA